MIQDNEDRIYNDCIFAFSVARNVCISQLSGGFTRDNGPHGSNARTASSFVL
jgi:hypothetical protein